MREIILGSASPRRGLLLKQIGLKFRVIPSEINEDISVTDNDPESFVRVLSRKKAVEVASRINTESLVIGADTIVVKKNRILGKPQNRQEAYKMLKMLQGSWHEVITGLTLIDPADYKSITDCEKTNVRLRQMDDDFINAYIDTGESMDKAGSYGVQGIGALLVERIEGCYYNVVGLPLARLNIMFEKFDYKIFSQQILNM